MQMLEEPQFGHPLLLLAILSWHKTSCSFR